MLWIDAWVRKGMAGVAPSGLHSRGMIRIHYPPLSTHRKSAQR